MPYTKVLNWIEVRKQSSLVFLIFFKLYVFLYIQCNQEFWVVFVLVYRFDKKQN